MTIPPTEYIVYFQILDLLFFLPWHSIFGKVFSPCLDLPKIDLSAAIVTIRFLSS